MKRLRLILSLLTLRLRLTQVQWIAVLFFGALLPLGTAALFAPLSASASQRVLIGSMLFSAIVLTGRIGPDVVAECNFGRMALLATTHVGRSEYIASRILHSFLLATAPIVVGLVGPSVGLASRANGDVWVAGFLLTYACLISLSLCVSGSSRRSAQVGMLSNFIASASLAFCPLMYAIDRVPTWLRPMIRPLPFSLGAELIDAVWTTGRVPVWEMGLMIGWLVVFGSVAWRVVPWTHRAV